MRCAPNLSAFEGADYERIEDYQHLWDPQNVVGKVGACVIVLIICSGTVGNVLVLVAVCFSPRLRKSYNAFIAALAVTDLIFNLFIMPFYADTYIHRDWRFSNLFCDFNTFFGTMVVISSSLHIAVIAVNRYVLIVHQDWYAKCFSKPAITLQITLIWLISFFIVLPGILGWHAVVQYSDQIGRCNYVRLASKWSLYIIFGMGFILPCLVMLYCYLQISIVVYQSKQKLASYRRSGDRNQDSFLMQEMRPRCRTMPEGKEARRMVKAVTRKATMLNLLTSGALLPSPYSSSEDIVSSKSQESLPVQDLDTQGSKCANGPVSVTTALLCGESTPIPNGCQPPPQTPSTTAEDNNGSAAHDTRTDVETPKQTNGTQSPKKENPTIIITTVEASSGPKTDSTAKTKTTPMKFWKYHSKRRMSQSLTCLEVKTKRVGGRSYLFPRRLKRHTIPQEKFRRQTTLSAKRNSASNSFLQKIHQRHHHKRHFKSFKMILAVFLGFALTYLPFTLLNFVDKDSCLNRAWYMLTSLFFWSGACINPWIYGIMNAQFRDAYQDILCLCKKKTDPFKSGKPT